MTLLDPVADDSALTSTALRDAVSFEQLFDRYDDMIQASACRLCVRAANADDIHQGGTRVGDVLTWRLSELALSDVAGLAPKVR
jgi:hypothetical protein